MGNHVHVPQHLLAYSQPHRQGFVASHKAYAVWCFLESQTSETSLRHIGAACCLLADETAQLLKWLEAGQASGETQEVHWIRVQGISLYLSRSILACPESQPAPFQCLLGLLHAKASLSWRPQVWALTILGCSCLKALCAIGLHAM